MKEQALRKKSTSVPFSLFLLIFIRFAYLMDGHEKVMEEALRVVGKYHDPIIKERIQYWENGEKDVEDGGRQWEEGRGVHGLIIPTVDILSMAIAGVGRWLPYIGGF